MSLGAATVLSDEVLSRGRERVEALLRPHERILWLGRPSLAATFFPDPRWKRAQRRWIFHNVLLWAATIVWTAREFSAPGWWHGIGVAAAAEILLLLPLLPLLFAKQVVGRARADRARRSVYALTTDRVLILGLGVTGGPPVWKNLEFISGVSVEQDGSTGIIVLGPRPDPLPDGYWLASSGQQGLLDAVRGWQNRDVTVDSPPVLRLGDDAEAVNALLRDAQATRIAAVRAASSGGFPTESLEWHNRWAGWP